MTLNSTSVKSNKLYKFYEMKNLVNCYCLSGKVPSKFHVRIFNDAIKKTIHLVPAVAAPTNVNRVMEFQI